MFLTVDVAVIEMVLESVGGSQDRAIESLLQMTDPDFKPDELASARQEESNQVDLDAEFARAVALQDEEEARQQRREARAARGAAPPSNASRLPEVLPYQPRVRKPRRPAADPYESQNSTAHDLQDRYDPPPTGQNAGELPPGLTAFEEKVTAMAESELPRLSQLTTSRPPDIQPVLQQRQAEVCRLPGAAGTDFRAARGPAGTARGRGPAAGRALGRDHGAHFARLSLDLAEQPG
jgi:hypothetical protein